MKTKKCIKQFNDLEERVFLKEPPEGEGEVEVEVQPDTEITNNESSASDTVYGQGTNPKPEDETYLNQLKGSIKPTKIKIDITKDDKKVDPAYKLGRE